MTLTRNELITRLYNSNAIDGPLTRIPCPHLRQDLRQEVFLVLCSLSESRVVQLCSEGLLRWYALRIMRNLIKSKKRGQPFFDTYSTADLVPLEDGVGRIHPEVAQRANRDALSEPAADEAMQARIADTLGLMKALPERSQQSVWAYAWFNCNAARASRFCGIPERCIRRHVEDARALTAGDATLSGKIGERGKGGLACP